MEDLLLKALSYIPSDDYGIWTKVGMALKYEGRPFEAWDDWSSGSSKYKGTEKTRKKWDTFNALGADIVKGGTIMELARQYGWSPGKDDGVFSWNDVVDGVSDYDYTIINTHEVGEKDIPGPPDEEEAWKDLPRYLNLLFQPDDCVGYCDKPTKRDGRWVPIQSVISRTQQDLLKALKKGIDNASIRPFSEGGAFIRFNPLDGKGESDSNVREYRYCLVEDDSDPIEKQFALLQKMRLPIICIVHSGNKSLHAIVKVDAGADLKTFRDRTNFIYSFCRKNGLNIDPNVKNPSRYSRMPGIKRGDNWQYIVAENLGFSTYDEWRKWVDIENDNLPGTTPLSSVFKNPPPLKEELIEGILRKGHKMLISGPSKAGKSFALMGLATAIANGGQWMGHGCHKGKVLYINLEVDEASCIDRFISIHKKLGLEGGQGIDLWNLRGRAVPMDKLVPLSVQRYRDSGYVAIIVDPIYKVITGDENSATEMAEFCSYFDKLALELGAAIIYCHHDSKGASSKYTNVVDRSSGSGVFARDPDAILNLTQLHCSMYESRYREQVPDACEVLTAWELTGTIREFVPMAPIRIWFDYPIHKVDMWNFLAEAKYKATSKPDKGRSGVGEGQTTKEEAQEMLQDLFDMCFDQNEAIDQEQIKEDLGLSDGQIIHATKKETNFERVTLEGGAKVVIIRGLETCLFEGKTYSRKMAKHKMWGRVQ